MNVKMCCKKCGRTNITVKATMKWEPFHQSFKVHDFIDDSWECINCGPTEAEQVVYSGEVAKEISKVS